MTRPLRFIGLLTISGAVVWPSKVHAQAASNVITAIASTLIPAITDQVSKFWKPKNDDSQQKFNDAVQRTMKTTLKPFINEANNLSRIRAAFELARQMARNATAMETLSSTTFLVRIKSSADLAKQAVASEYLFNWSALNPYTARAKDLTAEGIDVDVQTDLQRNIDRIQQATSRIAAAFGIPPDLQGQLNATTLLTEGLPDKTHAGTASKADQIIYAMERAQNDVHELQNAIQDLGLMISVRLAAYEAALKNVLK